MGALEDYLNSADIATVAKAARILDKKAWVACQISTEEYHKRMAMSDKDIFIRRNSYRFGKGTS